MAQNLFVISGPSGSGKDSIIDGLKKYFPVEYVVTTTSRARREGEIDGRHYYFISEDEFKKRIDKNAFFEWAQVDNGNYYGVTHEEISRAMQSGRITIWKIDIKGVLAAKKLMPGIKAIFISVPLAALEKRIRERDKLSEQYVRERMAYAREWLRHKSVYDYEVSNEEGRLDEATEAVARIIGGHHRIAAEG